LSNLGAELFAAGPNLLEKLLCLGRLLLELLAIQRFLIVVDIGLGCGILSPILLQNKDPKLCKKRVK
jgi:hypothetical protein